MMTIRFPNGQAVQYNGANYVHRFSDYSDLYEKKDGKWIAQVPNTCIIEVVTPCRVYNPLQENQQAKIDELTKEIKLLKRKVTGKK